MTWPRVDYGEAVHRSNVGELVADRARLSLVPAFVAEVAGIRGSSLTGPETDALHAGVCELNQIAAEFAAKDERLSFAGVRLHLADIAGAPDIEAALDKLARAHHAVQVEIDRILWVRFGLTLDGQRKGCEGVGAQSRRLWRAIAKETVPLAAIVGVRSSRIAHGGRPREATGLLAGLRLARALWGGLDANHINGPRLKAWRDAHAEPMRCAPLVRFTRAFFAAAGLPVGPDYIVKGFRRIDRRDIKHTASADPTREVAAELARINALQRDLGAALLASHGDATARRQRIRPCRAEPPQGGDFPGCRPKKQ